ncbi:hypothetical protein FQN54_003511 [Arachnomyces sp. PD_36]|nr:hypothetical protein FQN54_003511 [Arachnomyces sp. PD_36]
MVSKLLTVLLYTQVVAAKFAASTISELQQQIRVPGARSEEEPVDPADLYPAYNLSVPIDHFHNETKYAPHSNETFSLRYWFDSSHYETGGPVIILSAGETDGEGRLPYLQKGILGQLAKATRGVGVVLEHRYYGTSVPTPDMSTENLRFLTTDQALADTAYFAKNVVFDGMTDLDLTAPNVPYIAYGGSYAGAFVSFLRKLYPDVFFGAISSSGVTKAIWDYWEYYEPVRLNAPEKCVATQQALIDVVDGILLRQDDSDIISDMRDVFGVSGLTHDDDFANLLSLGIGGWQSRNWDPAMNDPSFDYYCGNITTEDPLYPATAELRPTVEDIISVGGGVDDDKFTTQFLNWIGYVNASSVAPCHRSNQTDDQCFTSHNSTFYKQDDIAQQWRSWPYQYCTEWGYLQTGSGVPEDQLPLISRALDIEYLSTICREAFGIDEPADVEIINKHGGFNISYPRLAIIDGEADPWKEATPHASAARPRESTTSEPFILIPGAVHHWDENGLFPNETTPELPPPEVRETQEDIIEFVKEWLKEW